MRDVHFLESLDSVRAPLSGDQRISAGAEQLDQAAAVRCEALVALAFGRDIVIPQSYVLDSYASQELVQTVAIAEARLGSRRDATWLSQGRAIRLHLHGQTRFVDAAALMFGKVNDATWTSSLYPDMCRTEQARQIAAAMSSPRAANPLEWITDWRADLFQWTWDYFRTAQAGDERRVVTPKPTPRATTLSEGIQSFVARNAVENSGSPLIRRTAMELDHLIRLNPQAFRTRSAIHGREPWTCGADERSAWDIVADRDVMLGVLEVVDTIYNRAVVESIGNIHATYTTRIGNWAEIRHEGAVQDRVLDSSTEGEQRAGQAFEITFEKPSVDAAVKSIPSLLDPEAFAAILDARDSTDWRASFQNLRAAGVGSDADRVRAVNHHTRLVSRALDGLAQVNAHDDGGVWIEAKAIGGTALASGIPTLLAVYHPWLALTSIVPVVGPRLWRGLRARRESVLRCGALGTLVRPRQVPRP